MSLIPSNSALYPEHLKLAYERNWFRLFVRNEFGGAQLLLPDALIELAEASRVDGSLGWCVNLGSGASYFSGFLKPEVATSLLSDSKSAFAGSGQVGTSRRAQDGFEISGYWQRCTGSAHATTFTVNAENEAGEIHSYCLDKSDVEISDEWSMIGLQASSTYAIRATAAFVPKDQRFLIGTLNSQSAYAIHHIPFEPFARACMLASLLGMAKGFAEQVDKSRELLNRPRVPDLCAELKTLVATSFDTLLKEAHVLQENPNRSDEILKDLVINSAAQTRSLVMQLVDAGGLHLVDLAHPANLAFRDFLVAGQHNLFR